MINREALAAVCMRRGVDLSNVNVYLDSSKTPLSLITTETFWLGGKHLRIKGIKCSSKPLAHKSAILSFLFNHSLCERSINQKSEILFSVVTQCDRNAVHVTLSLFRTFTHFPICRPSSYSTHSWVFGNPDCTMYGNIQTYPLLFLFVVPLYNLAKDGVKSPVRNIVSKPLLQHQSSRKSSGVSLFIFFFSLWCLLRSWNTTVPRFLPFVVWHNSIATLYQYYNNHYFTCTHRVIEAEKRAERLAVRRVPRIRRR